MGERVDQPPAVVGSDSGRLAIAGNGQQLCGGVAHVGRDPVVGGPAASNRFLEQRGELAHSDTGSR